VPRTVTRPAGIVAGVTNHPAGGADRPEEAPAQPISKWDRPPAPKDWRYFVGGFGRVLIVIGLLMFGFVAYQLWGTGIETARAQNRLEDQFQQAVTEQPATTEPPPTTAPTTTTASVPDTTSGSTPESTAEPATPAPTVATTTTTSVAAVEQELPPIERGEALAKLEIPRIGKDGDGALYVVPGVSVSDLKKGPGHYPDTPLPGQLGNSAIAGHRTTYGAPFNELDELDRGDEIRVTMLSGDQFVYEVTGTEVVKPSDYHVVTDSDPSVATLTLTTCDPEFSAKNRLIVYATLRPEESAPVGEPTYYELEAETETETETETDDEAVEQQTTSESGDEPPVTEASGPRSTDGSLDGGFSTTPPSGPTVDDAFAEGWFHDSDAWPHIIGWGLVLAAIAFLSRRLSRHYRRDSIGVAAAVIPFVVCLYFFYQNINRLLPPGL
jgi:sortase A